MYTFIIYYTYKICLLIKFAPDPFSILKTLIYTDLLLPIPICRPWTSLGNTVFTQIVSSYNYERLIRSISTPFCLPIICTYIRTSILTSILTPPLFIRPFYLSPLFVLPFFYPLYLYALFVLIFIRLYSYSLSSYSLLFSPLYVHIICTPFF